MGRDIYATNALKSKTGKGRNSMGQLWTIPSSWKSVCKFEEVSSRTSALIIEIKRCRYVFIGT